VLASEKELLLNRIKETEREMHMNDEKPTRDPTKTITLDDTQHVAFLKMRGWKVTLWIETDEQNLNQDPNTKRVTFQIEGEADEIGKEMDKFYLNESVPILDFCRALKDLKTQMYALRRMKRI